MTQAIEEKNKAFVSEAFKLRELSVVRQRSGGVFLPSPKLDLKADR
jgi:hypothetical protein